MKTSTIKKPLLSILILVFIFGFSYGFPRFLVSVLGEKNVWVSYFYTYGMGLIFFLLSIIWIFTRPGADPLRRKQETLWLIAICCGFTFMFSLHGLWIFLSENFPIKN